MGRKPTRKDAIPRLRPRKRGKVTYYFYDHGIGADGKRNEEPLGKDYGLAIKRWAELEHASNLPPPAVVMFKHVADAYRRDVIPTKAERTQRDNAKELANLLAFFDDPPCPFESIKPGDVQDYMRWRKDSPVRATREKALLSHIWNWARGERYTDLPNPCSGIRGKAGKGRDAYIEDDEYRAIWEKASPTLRDAMDLAYLTGQRPADVLRMDETHIRDEVLKVRQGKTGAKVRVSVAGSLPEVLDRIRKRKAGYKVYCTRLVVNAYGRPVGVNAISRHWTAACKAAGVAGYQFRDLRAKAATDVAEAAGAVRQAKALLGHASERMTEHYTRNRRGAKVAPAGELRKLHPKADSE
jgi:integrase